jgi:hypothetical protein
VVAAGEGFQDLMGNTAVSDRQIEHAGDVTFETDFRSVYAQITDRLLGADSVALLGGDFRKSSLSFI